jgi:hypothetical protein
MVNLQLDWQQAAGLAAALLAGRVASGRSPRTARLAPYLQEAALVVGLYALWQLAASVSVLGTEGAFARARWIERFQHTLRLPSERTLQHIVLGHPLLTQACNLYYASMHFGVLLGFLLWLFVRHRRDYPLVRTILVVLTTACLVIQLIPVAPPRLLPGLGYVDTAARYGQSVYNVSGVTVDSLSAMPSVHVGWALLIAWAVIRISPSRHRWWILLHPALTVFVVVATANHFWLDGIVAGVLLLASIVGVKSLTRADDGDPSPQRAEGDQRVGHLVQGDLAGNQSGRIEDAVRDVGEQAGVARTGHPVAAEPLQLPADQRPGVDADRRR